MSTVPHRRPAGARPADTPEDGAGADDGTPYPADGDAPADLDGAAPVLDAITAEPPDPLPSLAVLRALVRDAAHRAAALLQGNTPEVHDTVTDIARFTAGSGDEHVETAAAHLGLPPARMRRLAVAHRHGGPHGVAACFSPRPADPGALAEAEAAIQPLRPAPHSPVERHHNRLTDLPAGVQLRHGPDGRWYPYVDRYGTWQPVAGPHRDPARAYRAARLARRRP